jgi:hypothetical protein
MSRTSLDHLDGSQRRRLVIRSTLKIITTTAVLLLVYAVIPIRGGSIGTVIKLLVGLAVFVGLLSWQIRSILVSRHPELRAAEALGLAIPTLRAFARFFSVRVTTPDPSCGRSRVRVSSTSTWVYYQTSKFLIAANAVIAVRYVFTVSSTTRSWPFGEKPFDRAAINMLAPRRLTSHSHGPPRVSSKSLMSNMCRRSAEPNTPKFDR